MIFGIVADVAVFVRLCRVLATSEPKMKVVLICNFFRLGRAANRVTKTRSSGIFFRMMELLRPEQKET